jgi:Protein of unknown function (DUF3276)
VDNENNQRRYESVYSNKVRAGKRRTYFFDVRQTKGEDYYLTLTESTKRFNDDGYERHKIFLYKEDFNRFLSGLEDAINHVKTELMPDYDYDEYTRRHEEWEAARKLENEQNMLAESKEKETDGVETDDVKENTETEETVAETTSEEATTEEKTDEAEENKSVETEDDISW